MNIGNSCRIALWCDQNIFGEAERLEVRHFIGFTQLLGEAKEKIRTALKGIAPMESVPSLEEAVRLGYSRAEPGEVVLLAPACTSFDMFQNFEERGEVFKREVLVLEKEPGKERL